MKVLVTNPPWPGPGYGVRSDVRWPHKRKDKYIEYPLYLGYTVAVLKNTGMDVRFLDGIVDELSIDEFAGIAADINPDMAVIECSTPSIDYDLATARALKQRLPELFVLLVGSHPTFFHRQILEENPFVDGVCRGEFEYTVRDLAFALSNGKNSNTAAPQHRNTAAQQHRNTATQQHGSTAALHHCITYFLLQSFLFLLLLSQHSHILSLTARSLTSVKS